MKSKRLLLLTPLLCIGCANIGTPFRSFATFREARAYATEEFDPENADLYLKYYRIGYRDPPKLSAIDVDDGIEMRGYVDGRQRRIFNDLP